MTHAPDRTALRDGVEAKAHELGFALVGVARAAESSRRAALERWIADGKHGEMSWLAERVAEAADVRTMLRNARSVICVADRYHDGRPDRVTGGAQGRIARYARGKDYHDIIRDRLRKLGRFVRELAPGCQTRLTGDIHPILEREQAARALLGAYHRQRPLLEAEGAVWLTALRAAALRFWLSRLKDSLAPRSGALAWQKDPAEFEGVLRSIENAAADWLSVWPKR